MSRAVRWAALGAGALTVHAAVNARLLRTPAVPPTDRPLPRTSLLLPVRDEAARLPATLPALLAQDVDEVVVLDDGSTDGTADLVRTHLAAHPRARLVTAPPLPAGWLGKPHACHQLALEATGDVLVFVDADVVLAPGAVRAAVALLEDTGLDLVSPYPRQVAPGPTRLVQPLLQWSWLTFLPLRLAERPGHPSLAAANGQLLVVRRDAYDRAGGHAAVRAEVVEDVALLRAVKAAGGRGGVVDGTHLATCRMYDDGRELAAGYAKSLHTLHPGVPALLGWLYVLPALAALRGSRWGLAGWLAGALGRVVTGRRTGAQVWPDALGHPLSVAAALTLWARSRTLARRGALTWRGRPVAPAPTDGRRPTGRRPAGHRP